MLGRWRLQVKQLDGKDIQSGTLTITGLFELNSLSKELGMPELGFEINAGSDSSNDTVMELDVDVTAIGSYKKNVLHYFFKKVYINPNVCYKNF